MLRAITVYCSSSKTVPQVYFDAARDLGIAIAKHGWQLVYGGNCIGCMDALAEGARSAGGKVIGITPQVFVDHGVVDRKCDELIVTETMRQRKEIMELRGDAFVTLPGGLGTLEEISEILVGKSLGQHVKPIVVMDIAGYYKPLIAMIEHGIEHGFIKPRVRELYFVAETVGEAIAYLSGI